MKAERQRLARLRRLERLREIAKRAAAAEAAAAEGTLAQLEALAARTRAMAGTYAVQCQASDGAALRQLLCFTEGLLGISQTTASDVAHARISADAKMAELARAERRRAATESRADEQSRRMAKAALTPSNAVRTGLGTHLE